jgi:hypothetical protein
MTENVPRNLKLIRRAFGADEAADMAVGAVRDLVRAGSLDLNDVTLKTLVTAPPQSRLQINLPGYASPDVRAELESLRKEVKRLRSNDARRKRRVAL